MASIPNARRYDRGSHKRGRRTTGSATAQPAQQDATATGSGWFVAATLAGLGVLYLVGGPWAAVIGGISLVWLLSS